MKFVVLISLAASLISCSYMPFIAEEALEVLEEGVEAEIREHMVKKWYEEDIEEAADFKEKFLDGFALRIRKVKWPWGVC